ncbi:MAG: response regulator [Deltaproteobacteria bacterium]|nr:response regulator [Deltaproteobacteria bacterium]
MGPRIGELLVQAGVINEHQLQEALVGQTENGRRLASELLAMGYANERAVCEVMSEAAGHPVLVLSQSTLNLAPLELIPEAVASRHPFLPVAIDDETVTVAVADLQSSHVLDQVAYAIARRVTTLLIPHELLDDGLKRAYAARRERKHTLQGVDSASEQPYLEVVRGFTAEKEEEFSDLLNDLRESYDGLIGQSIPETVSDVDPFALEGSDEFSFANLDLDDLTENTENFAGDSILPLAEPDATKEEPDVNDWEDSSDEYVVVKPKAIPESIVEATSKATPAFDVASLAELSPEEDSTSPGTAHGRMQLVSGVDSKESSAEASVDDELPLEQGIVGDELPADEYTAPSPDQAVVLIVEDDPSIRTLIRRALSFDNYHIIEAATGDIAVSTLRKMRPHVVVLDAMLPGVHGFEICAKIKSSPTFAGTKVVMVSAVYRGWEQAREIQEVNGADAFIEKPFEVQFLRKMVADLTGKDLQRLQLPADQQANITALTHQARSCAAVRDFKDALRHTDCWLECDPFDPEGHLMRGNIFTAMGDFPRALVPFEAAAVYGPSMPEALLNLALTYDRLGFRRRALESYSRARDVTSDPAVRTRLDERLRQG